MQPESHVFRQVFNNAIITCQLPENFDCRAGINILVTVNARQFLHQLSTVFCGQKQTLMSLEKLGYRLPMSPSQHF